MPQVNREHDVRGHDRRRVRADGQHADSKAHLVRFVVHRVLQGPVDGRRARERVTTSCARRGPGMALLAEHLDAEGPLTLDAGDNAHWNSRALKKDALLDVRLNISGHRETERPARKL